MRNLDQEPHSINIKNEGRVSTVYQFLFNRHGKILEYSRYESIKTMMSRVIENIDRPRIIEVVLDPENYPTDIIMIDVSATSEQDAIAKAKHEVFMFIEYENKHKKK